ncbi:MAG: type II secretion system F family protein [Actinomycetota bacterium]
MNELLLAAMCGVTAWVLLQSLERRDPVVSERLDHLVGFRPGKASTGPFARVGGLVVRLGARYPGDSGEAITGALAAAGMPAASVAGVRGRQLALAGAGFLLGLFPGALAIVLAPVGAFVGYRMPRFLLARKAARRREGVAAALPDAVDLLAVCTHAGLNVALSLKRVAGKTPGVLGEELRRTLAEIEMGVPRQQALRSLAQRSPHPDLEAMVGTLENAERFGNQVSSSLESFSAEVRARRMRGAEEQARKAPVKMLFPLIFLILPAFVLLSVVPLMLSVFTSLSFG